MKTKLSFLSLIVILTLVLTGCQAATSAQASSNGAFSGTPPAGFNPGGPFSSSTTATPTAAATPKPTATATATAQAVTAGAVSSATAYFTDLQNKDFTAASQFVSVASLSYAGLTRTQAAASLQSQSLAGAAWSDLKVVDSQTFGSNTTLVHVTYTLTQSGAASQVDETWAFRQEGGSWLFNWNNFIDTKTVTVDAQTANHITVQPTVLVRYTDRIELHFMLQNKTSDVLYFVQSYDTLAVFHFGDQAVNARNADNKIVVSGLRTSYDEKIVVKGLFASYPSWVEIKKWQGYYPNPWYTFQF